MINVQSKARIRTWLALLAILFLAGTLPAGDSDQCAVCGGPFSGKVYLVQDKATLEKRRVCDRCLDYPSCFVCGLPVKTDLAGAAVLADGRVLCARDAKTAILQEEDGLRICREVRDELDRLFSRFLTLPQTNVTVEVVDRVHLQELFRIAGNDYDCPNIWGYTQTRALWGRPVHRISLMSGLPLNWFRATCAHEYTHVWLNENLPGDRKATLRRDANEGFCELISYLFMDSQHDEAQKELILRNAYTRGQIHLFVDAEKRYGFNEVLDWMKFGIDGRLAGGELGTVRKIQGPHPIATMPTAIGAYQAAPASVPTTLALKAIFWDLKRPLALINDHTFGTHEEGRVRLGTTNVTVQCLAIRQDAVRIRLASSGEERELFLKNR